MAYQPIFTQGRWQVPSGDRRFLQSTDPATGERFEEQYPVSSWAEVEQALRAGQAAADAMLAAGPEPVAAFLDSYAAAIEARADTLAAMAHRETGLPFEPRLRSVELPRTTGQLRQAAAAARDRSWRMATIDTKNNIRSIFAPLGGPVVVFGPNNFPFAFNGISGGDFAAALAAGNPVIAKANPGHLGTTRLLAEAAAEALAGSGLPAAAVQMIYHLEAEDGLRLVAHPLTGATAFTGSRKAGLALKAAADAAGRLIYLEMSSINPLILLPGALEERCDELAGELAASCMLGAGQFCTRPGLSIVLQNDTSERFLERMAEKMQEAQPGVLLTERSPSMIGETVDRLNEHGAAVLTGGHPAPGAGFQFENTLLRVSGETFLHSPDALQAEAFGPVSLVVTARDVPQLLEITARLGGNLTGSIYSARPGSPWQASDETLYAQVEPLLRLRVGRLLNDKMPTGVAVSPGMVHGGPYPSTGHPGFTAVGIPNTMTRFAALQGYDNVRPERLPPELRDANPTGTMWRRVDGVWKQ